MFPYPKSGVSFKLPKFKEIVDSAIKFPSPKSGVSFKLEISTEKYCEQVFPSLKSGVSFKRKEELDFTVWDHTGFRPLKAGLVLNYDLSVILSAAGTKFPSPISGVSFKLTFTIYYIRR